MRHHNVLVRKIISINKLNYNRIRSVHLNSIPHKKTHKGKIMSVNYIETNSSYYIREDKADLVVLLREHIYELSSKTIKIQLIHDANCDSFYVTVNTMKKQLVKFYTSKYQALKSYLQLSKSIQKRIDANFKIAKSIVVASVVKAQAQTIAKNTIPIGSKQQYQLDFAKVKATKERLLQKRIEKARSENTTKPILKRTFFNAIEIKGKVVQFTSKVYKICNMTYKLVIDGSYRLEKIFRTERDAVKYITEFSNKATKGYKF